MTTQPHEQRGPSVLIVDDDAEVTYQFAQMLRLAGYEVRTAVDPRVGLRDTTSGHLDAIILDLRMPLMDGVAFLRELRSDPARRQVPVAIDTGDYLLDDSVMSQAETLGARIVFKPLWLDDLVSLVESLVGSSKAAAA